jgi:hypothetical protein
MRGKKPSQKTIIQLWKEATTKIECCHPNIKKEDFEFPAQCVAIFLEHYLDKTDEEIIGIGVPFSFKIIDNDISISDSFPLLSRNPYGTRITIFEMDWKSRLKLWMENDPLLSIYPLAYKDEYGPNFLNLTVHNLGDGSQIELIKKPSILDDHRKRLAMLLDLCYNHYSFSNDQYCSRCKIASKCHNTRYIE